VGNKEDAAMTVKERTDTEHEETTGGDEPVVLIRILETASAGDGLDSERGKILEARYKTADHHGTRIYVVWSRVINCWAGVKHFGCMPWYGDPESLPYRPLTTFAGDD
jgi:hypothetical protein